MTLAGTMPDQSFGSVVPGGIVGVGLVPARLPVTATRERSCRVTLDLTTQDACVLLGHVVVTDDRVGTSPTPT